jgi:hypothetical protein
MQQTRFNIIILYIIKDTFRFIDQKPNAFRIFSSFQVDCAVDDEDVVDSSDGEVTEGVPDPVTKAKTLMGERRKNNN